MKHNFKKWIAVCLVLLLAVLPCIPASQAAAKGTTKAKITLKDGSEVPSLVYVGQSFTLKVKGQKVTFASSNKEVATINAKTGALKVVSYGTAKITAKYKKKVVASVTVAAFAQMKPSNKSAYAITSDCIGYAFKKAKDTATAKDFTLVADDGTEVAITSVQAANQVGVLRLAQALTEDTGYTLYYHKGIAADEMSYSFDYSEGDTEAVKLEFNSAKKGMYLPVISYYESDYDASDEDDESYDVDEDDDTDVDEDSDEDVDANTDDSLAEDGEPMISVKDAAKWSNLFTIVAAKPYKGSLVVKNGQIYVKANKASTFFVLDVEGDIVAVATTGK